MTFESHLWIFGVLIHEIRLCDSYPYNNQSHQATSDGLVRLEWPFNTVKVADQIIIA
jgi:hypothetical protein